MTAELRFAAGFALLAIILFGALGAGWYFAVTWEPRKALGLCLAVVILGRILPRPIAWLVMLGFKRDESLV